MKQPTASKLHAAGRRSVGRRAGEDWWDISEFGASKRRVSLAVSDRWPTRRRVPRGGATRRARARRAKSKNTPCASSARRPARGNQRASCVDEPARGERRARGPFQNVGRQTRAQRARGRARAAGVASTHLADAVSGPAGARKLLCGRNRRRSGLRAGRRVSRPRGARRSAKLTPRARAQQRQEVELTTENT